MSIEIRCKHPIKQGTPIYVGKDGYAIVSKRGRMVGTAIEDSRPFEGEHIVKMLLR